MTQQTVIRDGVRVEKSVSEASDEDVVADLEHAWRCTLTLESEYEFPVAVEVADTLPDGLSAPNVAVPGGDTGGNWQIMQDQIVYRGDIDPESRVEVSYLLYTDRPANETLCSATTIRSVDPVDPGSSPTDSLRSRGDGGTAVIDRDPALIRSDHKPAAPDQPASPPDHPPEDGDGITGSRSVVEDSRASRLERSERAAAASDVLVPRRNDTTPIVSVVMPTMNEEAGIAECIDRVVDALATVGYSAEIIVSDSSDDDTPEIAAEMGAHVVTPDREGYGYAYRYAFARARGDYIVMGDADTTYDFSELPKLFRRMATTDADLVMGSRLAGEIKPGAMPPLHQYVGNPLLTKFLNVFYDAGVSDAHSGFRLFRRDVIERLNLSSDGMEFASEMIMQAGEQGLRIEEVPITYHERTGEATLDSFRDGWRHVRFMLVNAPGYLFTGPTVGLLVAGLSMMLLGLFDAPVVGVAFGTRTLIAGSLITIIGYQLGGLAIASSIAASPIRETRDPITNRVREKFRLEHGASIGLIVFGVAAAYATLLIVRWVQSGYAALPNIGTSMITFTGLVLGLQTIFISFFLSLLSTETTKETSADT